MTDEDDLKGRIEALEGEIAALREVTAMMAARLVETRGDAMAALVLGLMSPKLLVGANLRTAAAMREIIDQQTLVMERHDAELDAETRAAMARCRAHLATLLRSLPDGTEPPTDRRRRP